MGFLSLLFFNSMDFVPIDPSVPVEMDPLKVLLNFAGFTDTQVTKI